MPRIDSIVVHPYPLILLSSMKKGDLAKARSCIPKVGPRRNWCWYLEWTPSDKVHIYPICACLTSYSDSCRRFHQQSSTVTPDATLILLSKQWVIAFAATSTNLPLLKATVMATLEREDNDNSTKIEQDEWRLQRQWQWLVYGIDQK